MERNIHRKLISPVVINFLISSFYAGSALAGSTDISSPTPTVIAGKYPDIHYNVFSDLTFATGTVTGSSSDTHKRVLDVYDNARVTFLDDNDISGVMGFSGTSRLLMGIGSLRPVTEAGSVILVERAVGVIDNVVMEQRSLNAALDLQDASHTVLTARARVRNLGVPGANAVTLTRAAGLIVRGSVIEGEGQGIGIYNDSQAVATNAYILGGINGVFVTENGKLTLSGGTVISFHGGSNPVFNQGQHGAGVNIVGTSAGGVSGLGPGHSDVNISQGAYVVARGQDSSGISTQMYGDSTADVTVTDSIISGGKYGVLVDYDKTVDPAYHEGPGGLSTVILDNSAVFAGADAVHVNAGGIAKISLLNSDLQISGRNGVVLGVDAGGSADVVVDNSVMKGNVDNLGNTTLFFLNSVWTGEMHNVSTLALDPKSSLNLTGASAIGSMNNSGTVNVEGNQHVGNVLTVRNYAGNHGTLVFSAVLNGVGSDTDKMVVTGSTSGTTSVIVKNRGGTGAEVREGIELIHVDGQSAGDFVQKGRILAGAYDYHIIRGQNENSRNWYLDSRAVTLPPSPPEPVVHLLRPEAAAYISNQAATDMFLTTLHERAGENRYLNGYGPDGGSTSLWLRQSGSHFRFRDGTGQLLTSGNTYVAQIGGNIAKGSTNGLDTLHLGIMAGYGNTTSSTHSTYTGYDATGSVQGYSTGLYGTWYQHDTDPTGMYVDGQLLYSWFDNGVTGDGVSTEHYGSDGVSGAVETGYTLATGQSGAEDNPVRYFIEPHLQLTWMDVKAHLTESNGTRVTSQGDGNVRSQLGLRAFLQGHNQKDNGREVTFQPFVEINWLHNTKRNGVTMNGITPVQAGGTDAGEIKLGVEGALSQTALWGNIGQQVGSQGYGSTAAMAGIRYRF